MTTTATRPFAISVNPGGLPQHPALTTPTWLIWRWAPKPDRPDEWTKPPLQARNGYQASVTNPRHWSPLADALAGMRRYNADGIGLVLQTQFRIAGIDLDHCRDHGTGAIEPRAQHTIDHFRSYTEPSASGTGIRILIAAALPAGGRKRGQIEVYSDGRYLTLNGNRLAGAPATIEPRQAELDLWYAELFPEPQQSERPSPQPVAEDDATLIGKARAASARFDRLWRGDLSDHGGDESDGEWAFCMAAAYWTGGDADRMDRWYRASGLVRAKWDERRGDTTYGARTIARACGEQTKFYRHGRRIIRLAPRADAHGRPLARPLATGGAHAC